MLVGGCDFEERPAACGDQLCEVGRLVGHRVISKEPLTDATEFQTHHANYWLSENSGPSYLFSEEAIFEEHVVKIYEDFLSDLGIASLYCRCRHGAQGFELRLRWFIYLCTMYFSTKCLLHIFKLVSLTLYSLLFMYPHAMYFCRFASVNPEQESKRGLPQDSCVEK